MRDSFFCTVNIGIRSEEDNNKIMDDSTGLARTVTFSVAGYPIYMARTLMQIGYEPTAPDQYGRLPNIFTYISIIREQKGYLALYTGLRYYLPAVVLKKSAYDVMATVTNHKKEKDRCDASEIIAVCFRESALRIQTTILTYPLMTLGVGYISAAFFGTKETVKYTLATLYKGIVPKLIVEVTMVWVSVISRRLTVNLVHDELAQAIISRLPPFIVQAFLYPFNVVSTVMADNGRSGVNPEFKQWQECFRYLRAHNQLKRGNSFFFRRDYQTLAGTTYAIKRYF